jgi:hypothetical protein
LHTCFDLRSLNLLLFLAQKIEMLEDRLNSNIAFKDPSLEERYARYMKKMVQFLFRLSFCDVCACIGEVLTRVFSPSLVSQQEAENEIKLLRKQIKSSEGIVLKEQLKCMKRVLRRLGLTNKGMYTFLSSST